MEEWHAKKQIASGSRLEQETARPSLIDLIGVRVADKLRRAGGASGMKVSCRLLAGNPPLADEPVGRLLLDQIVEGINLLCRIPVAVDLYDGLEVFQLPSYLLDLPPYVCARHRAEGHKDLGVSRLKDFRDLMRLEKRIDRIGDSGGFGTE